jgi:hypothetical protein
MTRRDIRVRPPLGAAAVSVTSRTPLAFVDQTILYGTASHPIGLNKA